MTRFWLEKLKLLLPWVRHAREESLNEELRSYMEMAEAEAGKSGLSEEEAAFAARRDLGNILRAKEQVRNQWLSPRVDALVQDLRYAVRMLRRTPVFTCVAVLSLALGIGSATTIFSLVEGVILRPLAYRNPGKLVMVREVVPAMSRVYPTMPVNIQHFFYWHDHTREFESIAAFRAAGTTLTRAGEPVELDAVDTSADLFTILGAGMADGRGFLPGEDRPGKNNVAVITDTLWRRRFQADPNLVGRSIVLDGRPTTIVGILRPDFTFPSGDDLGALTGLGKRSEVFRPLQDINDGWDGDFDYACIGRLKPEMSVGQALSELNGLTKQLTATYHVASDPHPQVSPLQDAIVGPVRASLTVLLLAVLALLLIVCVNLANLLLARASARKREFSIRSALGAGRGRVLQQVLTETAILAAAGGVLGTAWAGAAIRLFVAQAQVRLPRLDEVALNGPVLLFSFAITAICTMIAGAMPAYQMAQSDPQESLAAATQNTTANKQALRLRRSLVGLEVALSTVLLFVAGLLMSSLLRLMSVDKGFREERAITADLSLPEVRYPKAEERSAFFDKTLAAVREIPGVEAAALVVGLPLTGETHVNGIELEGADGDWIDAASKNTLLVNVRFISPNYFVTLGIPLLRGRPLEASDRNRHVTVISAGLAKKIWPGQNPLGKRFRTGSRVGEVEVVGISGDTYNGRLDESPTPMVYVPYWLRGPNYGSVVVRTVMDPSQLTRAIRRTIWSIDSELPIPPLRTMSELVSEALARRRFQMRMASLFGAGALALALIGIYGVVAYNVTQRRKELGLLLALGASRHQVVILMLRRGLAPVFIGLGCGLATAILCGWFIRSLLFGVTASDPMTMTAVAIGLSVTAVLACLIPASKAARMDPASVLRYE